MEIRGDFRGMNLCFAGVAKADWSPLMWVMRDQKARIKAGVTSKSSYRGASIRSHSSAWYAFPIEKLTHVTWLRREIAQQGLFNLSSSDG